MVTKIISTSQTDSNLKRKSFLMAFLLYLFLMLILFFIRFWPPSNIAELVASEGGGGGVTVNFGDTNLGSGNDLKSKETNVKAISKPAPTKIVEEENIISAEKSTDNVAVIPKTESKKKTPLIVPNKDVKIIAKKPVVRKTDNAVADLLKGNNKGGDGKDNVIGNKGKKTGDANSNAQDGEGEGDGKNIGKGDKYANSFYGDGKSVGGNGKNWGLKGRKLAGNSPKAQNCNEYGTVVVKVYVNKQGTVFKAERAQGTTNTDPCLVNPALETAKTFKWFPDPDAPDSQIGFVVINFLNTK